MTQTATGRIVEVSTVPIGDTVLEEALGGTSSIPLNSTVDFNLRDGQTLQATCVDPLDDAVMLVFTVTAVDHDTDTLTLSAPLPDDLPDGHPVYVYPTGDERVAQVLLDEGDDEPIPCRVPHGLYDRVPEGIREPDAEEAVAIAEEDDGEWEVTDLLGEVPLVDGSYLDPDTVTASRVIVGDPAGERVDVRQDGAAGVIEFFTGVADETTPGKVNPSAVAGWPGVEMVAGGTLSSTRFARVAVRSGDTTADPSTGEIVADEVTIADHNGNHYLQLTKAAGFVFASALDFDFLLGVINATMGAGSVGTGTFRDSVDARVTNRTQTGTVASAAIPADADNWTNLGTFAFPTAFTAAPNVMVQSQTAYGTDWIALRTTATTTNFTLYGKSPTAKVAQTVAWIAVSNG